MSVRTSLKGLAKGIPPIGRLVSHRDRLLAERDDLASERDQLLAERAQAGEFEISQAIGEVNRLHKVAAEREALILSMRDQLAMFGEGPPYVPNGHYYSPIAPKGEITRDDARIFGGVPDAIPGIDLRLEQQLTLLEELRSYYGDLPFSDHQQEGLRYHYVNPSYSYSDGIFLNAMLRHLRPGRVIEIGSGYTSAMFLDTNERWLGNEVQLTFIEPYPELLYSLLKEGDRDQVTVYPSRLQEVELAEFDALGVGDILFVDSTHVSRVGSDVNYIFFEILPRLKPGVFIHFHDIFFPFEYPRSWILEGRAWNEIYLLRAFLQFNVSFELVLFNTLLEHKFPEFFEREMPLCLKNPGGSIWLRKR